MTEINYARAVDFEEQVVYFPEHRPGYTAWVNLFLFGNGDIGLTFDEIRRLSVQPKWDKHKLETA